MIANSIENTAHQVLNFPEDIEISGFLGCGGRANVYKAKLNNKNVVVKVYKQEIINKYIEKYGVDIAQFEFDRNSALYGITEIQKYIAKPYRVYLSSSQYTHSIIQEYVSGTILEALINELGRLPDEILKAGYLIARQAEINGIHDLDISVGNLKISKNEEFWVPRLYDFNIMPQYLFPPNPILGLAFKLGIRRKSHRDFRSLKNWERRGKQKMWIGRN